MEDKIPKKITTHLGKDPVMGRLIEAVTPKVNESLGDVYNDLVYSIISQQISVKVAKVIRQRLLDLYQGAYPTPDQILDTAYDDLRSVGLSNQKTGYMINIANFWKEHNLHKQDWEAMTDQEIIDLLTQIKGVGIWTVQMILMFALERPDVFPIDDLVVQNGIIAHYNVSYNSKKEMKQKLHKIAEAWTPYKSTACRYLWRAKGIDPLS